MEECILGCGTSISSLVDAMRATNGSIVAGSEATTTHGLIGDMISADVEVDG
jgi:hypothetical protein